MVARFAHSRLGYVTGLVGLYAVGIAITALALWSCTTEPDRIYTQAFGYQCYNADTSLGDTLCKNRPAGRGQAAVSRYCYKTIADANCFDRPDVDRKNQALGSSGY
ncbi:MAG: hypothetical protein K1X51_08320 [Rhodospirillaceae bacterium]|nr:hypothetical protein [Rhodospirillaceae bacterium]